MAKIEILYHSIGSASGMGSDSNGNGFHSFLVMTLDDGSQRWIGGGPEKRNFFNFTPSVNGILAAKEMDFTRSPDYNVPSNKVMSLVDSGSDIDISNSWEKMKSVVERIGLAKLSYHHNNLDPSDTSNSNSVVGEVLRESGYSTKVPPRGSNLMDFGQDHYDPFLPGIDTNPFITGARSDINPFMSTEGFTYALSDIGVVPVLEQGKSFNFGPMVFYGVMNPNQAQLTTEQSGKFKIASFDYAGNIAPKSLVGGVSVEKFDRYNDADIRYDVYLDYGLNSYDSESSKFIEIDIFSRGASGSSEAVGVISISDYKNYVISLNDVKSPSWSDLQFKSNGNEIKIADVKFSGGADGNGSLPQSLAPYETVHMNPNNPDGTSAGYGLYLDLNRFSYVPGQTKAIPIALRVEDAYGRADYTDSIDITQPEKVSVALSNVSHLQWSDFPDKAVGEIRLADVELSTGTITDTSSAIVGESVHPYTRDDGTSALGLFLDRGKFSYVPGQTQSVSASLNLDNGYGHDAKSVDIPIDPRPAGVVVTPNTTGDEIGPVDYRGQGRWQIADAYVTGAGATDDTYMYIDYPGVDPRYQNISVVRDPSDHSHFKIYINEGELPGNDMTKVNVHIAGGNSTTSKLFNETLNIDIEGKNQYWTDHATPHAYVVGIGRDFYDSVIGYAEPGDRFAKENSNRPIVDYSYKMTDDADGFFFMQGNIISSVRGFTESDQNKRFTIETTNNYGFYHKDTYEVHEGGYFYTYHDIIHI